MSLRVAAVVLLLTCNAASALDCHSSPLRDRRHWSWRQIDGRTCWYPGRPGMSKANLRWPGRLEPLSPPDLTAGRAPPPIRPRDPAEKAPVPDSVGQQSPQDSFEDRFRGAR